jgi:hypothetical protein
VPDGDHAVQERHQRGEQRERLCGGPGLSFSDYHDAPALTVLITEPFARESIDVGENAIIGVGNAVDS